MKNNAAIAALVVGMALAMFAPWLALAELF